MFDISYCIKILFFIIHFLQKYAHQRAQKAHESEFKATPLVPDVYLSAAVALAGAGIEILCCEHLRGIQVQELHALIHNTGNIN